ncbi:MAG: MFS transporter [Nevskiales bacterium]|nr:MFS transporter [Nevskiales bacterium]
MSSNQFGLLRERRFGPFFWTQAFGAFNDNVYKNALVILIAFQAVNLTQTQINVYVNLAAGLFILPFFLFSATAGQLAEKYEKSRLIRGLKLLEIGIMLLAAYGLYRGQTEFLLAVLFLLGTQSALFGPVKYGLLPQHLKDYELVGGNGLVETGTFAAILLGSLLGGVLMAADQGHVLVGGVVVLMALAGYAASRRIPPAPAVVPDLHVNWNPFTETWRNFRFMQTRRTVFLSVLGISWFWFYGVTFLSQLPVYTRTYLGGDESVVTLLLTVFTVGVGGGSLLCERLSGRKVEIGLVPFGSIGLTLFGVDLYFAHPDPAGVVGLSALQFWHGGGRVLFDLFMIGLFGGFYIVPLYALVQSRSEPTHRSRIIAGNNILNALFMVVSAGASVALLNAGLSVPQLLLTAALMNAAVALFIYSLVPEFLMRFIAWLLINALYRIRVEGLDRIPDTGPCVVVCNHVSFIDALIVGGTVRRPVRFVMYYKLLRIPVLNWIFKTARAIPIAGAREDAELMNRAFDEIERALKAGEVVGIFPEGGLTPDGKIQPFRPGIERALQRTPVPVIPMALRSVWRSMWSRRWLKLRLQRARLPRRFRARIGLVIGEPVPPQNASAAALEQKVRELRSTFA